jgi:hypothetical protein
MCNNVAKMINEIANATVLHGNIILAAHPHYNIFSYGE